MTRMMYCTAVRRSGDTFSSRPNITRHQERLGARPLILSGEVTLILTPRSLVFYYALSDGRAWNLLKRSQCTCLCPLLQAVEKSKENGGKNGVNERADQFMRPAPVHVQTDQAASY